MKYCQTCGQQLLDEAVLCPHCGCAVARTNARTQESSGLKTAAKIFMVIECIALGWLLIPLCWMIPMTVHYFNATQDHRPVGIGFKVCTLFFVSQIAGILMLCDSND